MGRATLSGWGRTMASSADVLRVTTDEQLSDTVARAAKAVRGRGLLARGLGRSYGDAAQNGGGIVLDLTGRSRVLDLDLAAGTIEVEAGVSIDLLIRLLLPFGYFVPVTPGTRFVTIGGAIAADIHGKNHHRDGSIGNHVLGLRLLTGDGAIRELTPEDELFWATVGGMGLTGVVLRARLRLKRVETSRCLVETLRCSDLDALLAAMGDDELHEYSVAWIDCSARGARLGRSVLTRGRFAAVADLPEHDRHDPCAYTARQRLRAPKHIPSGTLNAVTVRAFNEAWFRRAPKHRVDELQTIPTFFHPLDGVGAWNRIYGRAGLLQYQMVVPVDETDALRSCVESFSAAGAPSFLSVLKRLGPANRGLLSFPREGWTLSVDIPAGNSQLGALLDQLDQIVLAAGGRSYFAKDSRMTPATAASMYPRLPRWRELRAGVDPHGIFISDLARRLKLCETQ